MKKITATTSPERTPEGRHDEHGSAVEKPSTEPPGEAAPREIGGRGGLDPVRYGDWEKNGRCIDF